MPSTPKPAHSLSSSSAPAEEGELPHQSSRRRRLIGGVAVAVVVLGGAVAYVLVSAQPGARSPDDALEAFRAEQQEYAEGSARRDPPSFGVYLSAAEGEENVGFGPLNFDVTPQAPVTVSDAGDGCWRYRVDLNTDHWREWMLCSDEEELVMQEASTSPRRDIPGLDFSNVTTFECREPVALLWPGQGPGDRRSGICDGESTGLDGVTRLDVEVEVAGEADVTVDGEEHPTLHVRLHGQLTGAQPGVDLTQFWLDPRTGLPLRLDFDVEVETASPIGTIDYRDVGTVRLESLEPAR